MTRSVKTSLLAAVAILLAAPASSQAITARAAQACPAAHAAANHGNVAPVTRSTLCLLNFERAARHLRPLRYNSALARAAAAHSRDMAARNYFAHNTLGGGSFVSRIQAARYIRPNRAWSVGENLAWGTGQLGSPAATVDAWMRSPGHRHNILSRSFAEIGIGVVAVGDKALYTTDFGRRG